jgi:hypothetical protein
MYSHRISRALFVVEAAMLTALSIYAMALLTRILTHTYYMHSIERTVLDPLVPLYFLFVLAASGSLFCLAVDFLLAGPARASPAMLRMTWIALAGSLVGLVGFALDAAYARSDEGNLSKAAVWFVFAPFLFLWVPMGHIWLERRRAAHLTIGSSDRGTVASLGQGEGR